MDIPTHPFCATLLTFTEISEIKVVFLLSKIDEDIFLLGLRLRNIKLKIVYFEASCGGTKCDCKTDRLWVRSPLGEIEYLLKFIFPFLRSGVDVKRGVEFSHSTRNASIIRQKVGNGVSYH